MKLSVIIPVYNEERHLERFIQSFFQKTSELNLDVIIINDASTDQSLQLLNQLKSKYHFQLISFERNTGKGKAIIEGIKLASGEFTIIQDADFEYNPDEIKKLLHRLQTTNADAVYGNRFENYKLSYQNFPHFFANIFLTKLSNLFTKFQINDMETCYKLIRTSLLKRMSLTSERFGIEVEITAKLSQLNSQLIECPISYLPRNKSQGKKINWRDGMAAIYHIFKFNLLSKLKNPNHQVELGESLT